MGIVLKKVLLLKNLYLETYFLVMVPSSIAEAVLQYGTNILSVLSALLPGDQSF